jgi:L-malate glycosyltransferase
MRTTVETCRQYQPSVTAADRRAARPVRVCFLIDELARAGTETQLLALIATLDRTRVLPYLCLLHGEDLRSRSLEPSDCPVLRLGVQSLARPGSLRAAGRFLAFLRREEIEVVQTYFPDSTFFGIPLAWMAGVPFRIRTRNNLGHALTSGQRVLGRLLNALSTQTIANCNAARAKLLADERPDPTRVIALENGVDLERFITIPAPRKKLPGEALTVGAVANLRAVKGLDLLIEAARLLRPTFPDLRFRVAGQGEHRPFLEQLIRGHELGARFELVGSMSDIPAFLAELDVAVLCSHAEGMPNAVLEYMAAGRPIVATNVGAVCELLHDGVNGLVISPGNASGLARALERLLGDRGLRLALGEAARRRVREHYSREAMVRRFEDFYLGIARPHVMGRHGVF